MSSPAARAVTNRRPRILQIFNRYLEYGGEQGSVFRIGDTLQQVADVEYFTTSSASWLGAGGASDLLRASFHALHNPDVVQRLRRYQAIGRFDLWLVHNVFPAMSPSVYSLAAQIGVPVVQYLHNYRMSCVNGYFLNHGKPCTSCIHGNFTKAALTGCWRGSRPASALMGLALMRLRALGVFRQVRAWIALSRAQRDLHVEMGVPADRIHVVPHFFEPRAVLAAEPGRDVLFLGRLSREKGVRELLRAWKLVAAGGAKLLIAGDGPERAALEEQARSDALTNVEFLGFLDEAGRDSAWSRAAFSVVPSIWQEPLGLVVYEAWERGRPVVVSRVGGLDDMVDDGVNGLKVSPGDEPALAAAISSLLADPAKVREMGVAGLRKLGERRSRSRWLEDVVRVLDDVLGPVTGGERIAHG
jgi:glycosyltransferase involved in cell wall biosynthesis